MSVLLFLTELTVVHSGIYCKYSRYCMVNLIYSNSASLFPFG